VRPGVSASVADVFVSLWWTMLRWILLGLTILCFVIVFTTKSALLLGLALLFGLVGFIGFIFSLAAERISSVSRPDTSMASAEHLASMGPRRAAKPAQRLAVPGAGAEMKLDR